MLGRLLSSISDFPGDLFRFYWKRFHSQTCSKQWRWSSVALEKEYSKSTKGPSGIIEYTWIKESVVKWNIIQHEKPHFTDFKYGICCLNDENEHSVYHNILGTTIEVDEICLSQLENYISQRKNPFNIEK